MADKKQKSSICSPDQPFGMHATDFSIECRGHAVYA